MCFSAAASFGSGTLLVSIGAVTTMGNHLKSQRMISVVPIFFGVQQLAEGIVWQTMGQNSESFMHQFGILTFLGFALVIWPCWLPWSVFNIEINQKRKKMLKIISFIGLGVSLLAVSVLLSTHPNAYISGHSLAYEFKNLHRTWPANLELVLYVIPTLTPFFISSLHRVNIAGYLVLVGMIITQIVNKEASTSIWCYFAAMISLYIAVNIVYVQEGKIV